MAISSVNNNNYNYGAFASGKKINRAADGAAESAIIEKMKSEVGGVNQGSKNIQSGIELSNVTDGALGSISDSLNRMKELSIQASNGTMSKSDKQSIQKEIDQLKEGISQIASTTQYNEKNVLDGTSGPVNLVTNGSGSSVSTSGANATLEALGIKDYDVTKDDFDMSVLDDALDMVNSQRSAAGATTNRLESAYNFNQVASYNMTGSQSKLEDLDYAKAISDMKKKETLDTYQMMMQKKQMEDEHKRAMGLFGN